MVNTSFWPPESTSTRSNTSSRSSDSPGTCWKCQASFPVVGIQRQRGAGVERAVGISGAAAGAHPGLGLRHAPVSQIEIGIVAAGDPGVAARAQQIGQLAPGVAAGFAFARHGVELPELLAGLGVVGADVARAAFLIAVAAAEALQQSCRGSRSGRSNSRSLSTCRRWWIPKRFLPVRASSATRRASVVAKRILS